MSKVTVKDNSLIEKEDLPKIESLKEEIAGKSLKDLEKKGVFVFPEVIKDAEDLTGDQMVLQRYNDTFRTGNVMGFIGCGDERLKIKSRFSGEGEDHFFRYLLNKALDFPTVANLKTDADTDDELFNYLLLLFPYYLKPAMRKGLYKQYIRYKYNDGNVKGCIDVVRHIEKNVPFIGNVAYSQREFSYDNHLTELVRHTVEFIKLKPYGSKVLSRVKEEVKLVIEATRGYKLYDRQKIIDRNKKHPVRHAYFREYRALQRLCLLILQRSKHQIGSGSRPIYGILFDGAWLWEEYINKLIGKWFYHPRNKGGGGAQRLFHRTDTGLIYPDFISKNAEARIIADAKYKRADKIGKGNLDYFQLLAYMFRFDAKKGYFLYPQEDGTKNKPLWLNKGSTYDKGKVIPRDDIFVKKHGLQIPTNAGDYKAFVKQIEEREKEFIKEFGVSAGG